MKASAAGFDYFERTRGRSQLPLFVLGNYNDLSEVIALAERERSSTLKKVRFEDINEALEQLRDGDVIGRAVVTF